jgi:DNA-binding CsgD family transcriptional regulator
MMPPNGAQRSIAVAVLGADVAGCHRSARTSVPSSCAWRRLWRAAVQIDGAGPADPRLGSRSRSADPTALTHREVEVLGLLVQGLTDGQIAERLFISPKTASVHVANIKGKLGGASRVDTVTRALRLGLVAIPEAPVDA